MKIVEMHIYGFGQLDDVKINNINDFQVFFGENEAGKSTIMAFIHGIFFGFPTKQQSELRYEPKHNAKYGGKLRVNHEELGFAVIERVRGKSAGDVLVTLDDGTVGNEELLKQLLMKFDKSLFQAIFSFNLQGLQNIHQMKGEEIGKFLFSAGTLGTERLSKTEAMLQKEVDSRFKPSGKKPIINDKLLALHELNGELKKASAKNQEYQTLIEKKGALQQEIMEIHGLLVVIDEKTTKLNEWKKIQSFVKEERWTKKEIDDLGEIHFPARGIERAEKFNQLIHPYNAQISSIADRIKNLKNELESIKPDPSFLTNESAILTILEQMPLYEQLKQEKLQCEMKLKEFEEKLSTISEKLHLPLNEEEIFSINTNIYMKNQVEMVSKKSQKLLEVKQELEDRYQEEKDTLEELEKDLRGAQSQIFSKQERERLEEQVKDGNDKNRLEIELNAVKDKIEFYQHAKEQDENTLASLFNQRKIQVLAFALVLFGFALYGVLTRQWVLLFLSVIGCALIGIFMNKSLRRPKENDVNQKLHAFREKEKQLIQKLESAKFRNISALEEQLAQDSRRKEKLQIIKVKLDQQHKQYDKVISKFEEWESLAAQNKEKLLTISKELKIPKYIANSYLLEAFQLIEQYKSIGRDRRKLIERLEQIIFEQSKMVNELKFYATQFLPEKSLDIQKSAFLLRNKSKEEHEKQIKSQEKRTKLAELEADMQQIIKEQQHVQVEFNKLLKEANVENEQQYYELGMKAEKRGKLFERLEDIEKQLQYSMLNEAERESFLQIHNCDEIISKCNDEVLSLQTRLKKLQEEQASIKYEIQILEEGGVYSDLLHQFKQKKFELEEEAKEWSVYWLAYDLLSKTVEKYKKIHLPRMLAKAEEYLLFLTDGNYQKIHLQGTGTGFLIERVDHTLFEANELSQATTEQVYVSIRLALATTLYENYRLPIIIDDSFVNFDARRTQKVMELLKRLDQNQILFFTCHKHLLQHFHKENVISLEKKKALNL
ncbi:AAA family ATPase [Neobacillus pocheonensis]|uniref:AAA family ATPase n=1 Tax=Neobacillus pocheonensis TaxID=363869 RepID=A0ABT0WE20_9BACI|nr:AAA family ATPase [Neobacillus pocheonensis]